MALDNGAQLRLHMAKDDANGIMINGTLADVPHDRVLLVSSNGRLVAIRAGGTQHWAEAPEAPEIKEAPMRVDVPAVGVPVRLEKVLVRPEDELVIECSYVYREGEG